MERELLHMTEVAAIIKRPVETLRRWRRTGEGPPMFRLGGRVMAYRDEVEQWIADQREGQRSA